MEKDTLPELRQNAATLVRLIRGYSLSQQDLWQQVPNIALEADGRSGYLSLYQIAYEKGFWQLQVSPKMYVDLATGGLVTNYTSKRPSMATDSSVIHLAYQLDLINAQEIVDALKEKAKEPMAEYIQHPNGRDWRNGLRRALNLTERYQRRV